jgi:hypothetical protein
MYLYGTNLFGIGNLRLQQLSFFREYLLALDCAILKGSAEFAAQLPLYLDAIFQGKAV